MAAPLFAALAADVDSGCASLTGLWNPQVCALAASPGYAAAFNDITTGDTDLTGTNSGAFQAAAGYDLATGLGSPKAVGLACPEITSVTPASAQSGDTVTIGGLGLEYANIQFGSTSAPVVNATATTATVQVPAGSGPVTVSAISVLGTGTMAQAFQYAVSPPASAPPPPASAPRPVKKTRRQKSKPRLIGEMRIGKTLSLSVGSWLPAPSVKIHWYAGSKAIHGATSKKLKLSKSLTHKSVTVRITLSRAGYTSKTVTLSKPGTVHS